MLDVRHRTSIYRKLVPILGDDDTDALMAEFPATDGDELVTNQFLRAELAELRGGLRTEVSELRTELTTGLAEVRIELHDQLAALTTRVVTWTVSAVLAGIGVTFAIGRALGN